MQLIQIFCLLEFRVKYAKTETYIVAKEQET